MGFVLSFLHFRLVDLKTVVALKQPLLSADCHVRENILGLVLSFLHFRLVYLQTVVALEQPPLSTYLSC